MKTQDHTQNGGQNNKNSKLEEYAGYEKHKLETQKELGQHKTELRSRTRTTQNWSPAEWKNDTKLELGKVGRRMTQIGVAHRVRTTQNTQGRNLDEE